METLLTCEEHTKFRIELEETERRSWYTDIQDYQTGRVYNVNVDKLIGSYKGGKQNNAGFQESNDSSFFRGEPPNKSTGD